MDTNTLILSRKYAQAFVNIFKKQLEPADIDKVRHWIHFLKKHNSVMFYLQLTSISDEVKEEVLGRLRKECKLSSNFDELVKLLLKHSRIRLLTQVFTDVIELYEEYMNIMEFEFISAHSLSEEMLSRLQQFMQTQINREVKYTHKIDSDLIAGVKLYSDTYLWEYSVSSQLKKVKV